MLLLQNMGPVEDVAALPFSSQFLINVRVGDGMIVLCGHYCWSWAGGGARMRRGGGGRTLCKVPTKQGRH